MARAQHPRIEKILISLSMGRYIPASHLENLRLYKYSGVDHSFLSRYVLQPYWTRLVELFPLWMAPNLITLIGFSFIVVNIATLLVFDPEVTNQQGHWMYFIWAIGLFLYQSFDAIDGKQARRTGTSGPLGEMFDHGCDALNTSLGAILVTAATGLGHSWWTVAGLYAAHVNFYLNTWEEYHTGTLYLSFFSGPVEGVIMVVGTFILTGLYGPVFWAQGWKTALGIHGLSAVPNVQLNHLLFALSQVVMVSNAVTSASNVFSALRKEGKPLRPAVLRLLPLFPLPILSTAWLYMSPRVLEHKLVYLVLYLGFAFSFQVGRMIVSYVTKYRYPRSNIVLVPMGVWVANLALAKYANVTVIPLQYEDAWIYGCIAYGFAVYMDFALSVIGDICAFFDIYCLSIKHKKGDKKE